MMSFSTAGPSTPVVSNFRHSKSLPFHGTRNPVTHSGRGFRAKFVSQKNRRMVRCESLLEMQFLYLAEFARDVLTFDEQPITISYRLNGRKRRYTPDFCLHWRDGQQWFVEVKPHELLALEKNQEKFAAIGEHFRGMGDTFITISDREIRHPIRMPFIRDLLRLRDDNAIEAISRSDEVDLSVVPTWGHLVEAVGADWAGACLAYRLVTCPLEIPLQSETPITLYKEADDVALFN